MTPPAASADVRAIVAKGSDRQYFRSGSRTGLALEGVSVAFGTEPEGTQLSDHIGYVTRYRIVEN